MPLGLIINELITNAFKYAFSTHTKGLLEISIKKVGIKEYQLDVKDNDPGLPEDFNITDTDSLGLKLVQGLSQQLRGSVSYQNLEKGGTQFLIFFKEAF